LPCLSSQFLVALIYVLKAPVADDLAADADADDTPSNVYSVKPQVKMRMRVVH
jgi:hypothetical protein